MLAHIWHKIQDKLKKSASWGIRQTLLFLEQIETTKVEQTKIISLS